jgi:hypothetical protein
VQMLGKPAGFVQPIGSQGLFQLVPEAEKRFERIERTVRSDRSHRELTAGSLLRPRERVLSD